MIEQRQKIVDKDNGDCFRACMASILELPNDERLPHIDSKAWWQDWWKFLSPFGLSLESDHKRIWRQGYWIAGVPSKNLGKGIQHAIVMKGHNVAFDPSTKKRYRKGRYMLGKGIVADGLYLVVDDASKLHKLEEYRRSL
jgi:hypothetical protein